MHFTLEPEAFVEKAMDQVDELSAATEKAFNKLSQIDDVTAGEVELT